MSDGDSDTAASIESRLLSNAKFRQHTILYGPPGTGKTHLLRNFGENLKPYISTTEDQEIPLDGIEEFEVDLGEGKEKWITRIVQFTPSTDETDLLWGLGVNKHGKISREKGSLIQFNDELKKKPDITGGLFVIDEMSRADVVRSFGQLLYSIEHEGVSIRYSEAPLSLSDKLWIVGTMNTADKSVKHIDIAFRRRFSWIPVTTKYSLITEWSSLVEDDIVYFPDGDFSERYRRFAEELNQSISRDPLAGPHLQLGHVLFFPMKILAPALDGDGIGSVRISDLLEHIRSVLLPQLTAYVGRTGQEKLQNWTTETVSKKAMQLQFITDEELVGMIKVVSNPNKDQNGDEE